MYKVLTRQDKQVKTSLPQQDFQTQIILRELKDKTLENDNMKAATEMLHEENNSLAKEIEKLKSTVGSC